MDQIIGTVDNSVGTFMTKPTIIKGVVHLFLILYAARLAPVPPKQVLVLIENVYFKLACFSLILWSAQFSPSTSILIALAFMVTINYSTTGKVWEMMENIAETQPVAPSKEVAISSVSQTMQDQVMNTPVVGSVSQNPNTIVITPSIVNTPNGPTVVNPTIVVAPATVSSPSGEKITVTPQVTTMTAPMATAMTETPMTPTITPTESIEAVNILVKAASSSEASDPMAVSNIANIAVANVTSQDAVTSIEKLAKQAVVAEAGVPTKVQAEATKVIDSIVQAPIASPMEAKESTEGPAPVATTTTQDQAQTSGCFPMRQYDMNKVLPQTAGVVSFEDYQTWTP